MANLPQIQPNTANLPQIQSNTANWPQYRLIASIPANWPQYRAYWPCTGHTGLYTGNTGMYRSYWPVPIPIPVPIPYPYTHPPTPHVHSTHCPLHVRLHAHRLTAAVSAYTGSSPGFFRFRDQRPYRHYRVHIQYWCQK